MGPSAILSRGLSSRGGACLPASSTAAADVGWAGSPSPPVEDACAGECCSGEQPPHPGSMLNSSRRMAHLELTGNLWRDEVKVTRRSTCAGLGEVTFSLPLREALGHAEVLPRWASPCSSTLVTRGHEAVLLLEMDPRLHSQRVGSGPCWGACISADQRGWRWGSVQVGCKAGSMCPCTDDHEVPRTPPDLLRPSSNNPR